MWRQWSKEAHHQFMDEAGIDYTVLSLPLPYVDGSIAEIRLSTR